MSDVPGQTLIFNSLIVVHLMGRNRGNGSYLINLNGRRITSVQEVGRKEKAEQLVGGQEENDAGEEREADSNPHILGHAPELDGGVVPP